MKDQITEILGKSHTTPIQFKPVNGIYGLYTYKGGVFVFRDGMDLDFDDLDNNEQKSILSVVSSKNWKLNKSLQ